VARAGKREVRRNPQPSRPISLDPEVLNERVDLVNGQKDALK
jgi:hypothetical protein